MKTLFILAMALVCVSAAEPEVPAKGMFEGVERIETADGKVYEGVRSVKVTPAYVTVMHEGGSARVYWEKLPEEMRTAYGYDREKALDFMRLEMARRKATQIILERDAAQVEKIMRERKAAVLPRRSAVAQQILDRIARDAAHPVRKQWPARKYFRPNAPGYVYYTTPDGNGIWLRGED